MTAVTQPLFADYGRGRTTTEDRVFQLLVIVAVLLELVVFVEPAPVDAVVVFCLGLGMLLGKLRMTTIGTLPLVALAVFALSNLTSMYDPFDPDRAMWYLLVTLYLLATWFFFVGLIGHYGQSFMARLIHAYCLAALISALVGIGAYFHLLPLQDVLLMGGRVRGFFKDPNVFGPFIVPLALFALARTGTVVSRKGKAFSALLFFVAVSAIFLSFSRACWLNCVVALTVFFAGQLLLSDSSKQFQRRAALGAAIGVIVGVILIALASMPIVSQMLTARLTPSGFHDYDRIRFATQGLALEVAQQRPLGIGPGQSEIVFDYATHSMYLRVLSENGWIALAALLIFIGTTIARSISLIRHAQDQWFRTVNLVVLACIAGHLINSFFIDTVHWRHIWFIYALPWANVRFRGRPFRTTQRRLSNSRLETPMSPALQ